MHKDTPPSASADVLEQFLFPERKEKLRTVLSRRTTSLTLVLDDVRNSHNISAVLRSSDAFGIARVHLVGESFEYSPTISLGTEQWVELKRHSSAENAIRTLKEDGYRIVILAPETELSEKPRMPVSMLPFEDKLALIMGNEQRGVSTEFRDAADIEAYIPMFGFVESLNVSVACAICLFCSTIASTPPLQRTAALNEDDHQRLKAHFLRSSVRNAELILKEVAIRSEAKAVEE